MQINEEGDFDKYRGKLAGAIILTQPERAVPLLEGNVVQRMGPSDFTEAANEPGSQPAQRAITVTPAVPAARQPGFAARVARFYKDEGVVAIFNRGSDVVFSVLGSGLSAQQQRTDGGTIFPTSTGSRAADAGTAVPTITLAVEHYNRMVRVLAKNIPVKVELTLETKFFDETTPNGFNTIAELPGSDPVLKNEVVMIGAHFDSLQAATGATDNAAGSAAMMEAMRILHAVGARPRRTIRLALWGGEEQGLLGSKAYVRDHFGDPATMVLNPEHENLSVYFNSDNGAGRVRGIWLQGNTEARAVFEDWMRAACGHRRGRGRPTFGVFDRPRLVRRCRSAGLPVHGRQTRIQLANPSLQHGRVRSCPARRPGAAGDRHRRLRLRCRDAGRQVSPKPLPSATTAPAR